jgi:glycosyltransferase involved in cell wall biosynthesis
MPLLSPFVAVIVPVYNVELYLNEALESIAGQTYSNWECILVNDCSTDRSRDIAVQWLADPRFRLIDQAVNRGVSAARNRGVQQASPDAEYIAFIDGDDFWEPDALATLVAAVKSCPDCVGAHARSRFVHSDGSPFDPDTLDVPRRKIVGRKRVSCSTDEPTDFDCLVFTWPINVGNVLLKRSVWEMSGGFNTAMAFSEDFDLWIRLVCTAPFAYADKVILNYRRRDGSATFEMARDSEKVRRQEYSFAKSLVENAAEGREQPLVEASRSGFRRNTPSTC